MSAAGLIRAAFQVPFEPGSILPGASTSSRTRPTCLQGMPGLVPPDRSGLFLKTVLRQPLDLPFRCPHTYPVSRPDGRPGYARKGAGEESPGSMDERCRITSGGAALRGEASG